VKSILTARLALVLCVALCALAARAEAPLRTAAFQVDATPPLGTPLCCGGGNPPAEAVDDPLSARGLVLVPQGQTPIVICAVDWTGIGNASLDAWRAALATAGDTTPDRVAVHTVHQHDAPTDDDTTMALLAPQGLGEVMHNAPFAAEARERTAAALAEAMQRLVPVDAVGIGEAAVEQVASNRRILGPDGKVAVTRWTATPDPKVRAEPEGVIDPMLKSVSLWNGETPVAVLTYYATHPQSHYGKGRVSADFPGIARAAREAALPGVPHIHFNGAAGNIGAGKYNDGAPENRAVLADRVADGMRRAWEATVKTPITEKDVQWYEHLVSLPLREEINDDAEVAALADPDEERGRKVGAATTLAFRQRMQQGHQIALGRLRLGPADILHMPAELFVEYQLAAQQMKPDRFVCMAAYGDYGPGYVGVAKSYGEGGYETGLYASRTSPRVEAVLMHGMQALLEADDVVRVKEPLKLFDGSSLEHFYTFIKGRGRDADEKQVFVVHDGLLRISGEEWGCITTHRNYADYHLVVEFKWGEATFAPREDAARDSGILVNSRGEDGGYSGTWMHGIECQMIEGGTGDLLVVGDGSENFALTASAAAEKQGSCPVYQADGEPVTLHSGRLNWWGRDPGWSDSKDYRGARDVEHPVGQWNRLECIVRGDTLRVLLNGVLVNEARGLKPASGKIQIQSEGAELFVRSVELYPLDYLPEPVAYSRDAHILDVVQPDGSIARARTEEEWAARRRHILGNFYSVVGPLPRHPSDAPLDIQRHESEELPQYTRTRITYQAGPGDVVPAWLLTPHGEQKGAALCLHQTIDIGKDEPAGLGENGELDYAHELACRGFVALCPDYPTFGVNRNEPEAYALGFDSITAKAIWNHRRGIDVLQEIGAAGDSGVICIGHSLGGHNALFLAAVDERVHTVVTSCGFNQFAWYYGGNLRGWAQTRYMPRIETLFACNVARMPFDFHELLAAIAPRRVIVSAPLHDENFAVEGVRVAIDKASPVFWLRDPKSLTIFYPDAGHEFPVEVRNTIYRELSKA
jgi:dienelactone hydrolase